MAGTGAVMIVFIMMRLILDPGDLLEMSTAGTVIGDHLTD